MTKAEWLACTDPQKMLEFLRGRASERKLRLFACACCRRVWRLLTDARSRKAVEVAERFALGGVSEEERERALLMACDAFQEADENDPSAEPAADITASLLCPSTADASHPKPFDAQEISVAAAELVAIEGSSPANEDPTGSKWERIRAGERAVQCHLLIDIIGNPFRPVSVDPSWLTPAVVKQAKAIYRKRAFDRLFILSTDLEGAGCTNARCAAILEHCRAPGLHMRGCWVVDLLLGKE
jgi:hypothetical protein